MGRDEIYKLVEKVDSFKEGILDLSTDEDLSMALMNLVSIEEHLYFTYIKTSDDKYLDLLDLIRRTRIKYLKEIVIDPDGEEWCISKHLLSSSMRLIEIGNKFMSNNAKEKAKDFYDSAFDLYATFFEINHKSSSVKKKNKEIKEENKKEKITYSNLNVSDNKINKVNNKTKNKKGSFKSFGDYIKEKLDCCREL